jgi:hypothetical protein
MSSAGAIRLQIGRFLENRFPAALSPAPRAAKETASTGIEPIDALLEGGLPVGAISEVTGPHCSGRTSLALAFLAQRAAELERRDPLARFSLKRALLSFSERGCPRSRF